MHYRPMDVSNGGFSLGKMKRSRTKVGVEREDRERDLNEGDVGMDEVMWYFWIGVRRGQRDKGG